MMLSAASLGILLTIEIPGDVEALIRLFSYLHSIKSEVQTMAK
jgi:hypothetical protein